ncbi:terminase large subunit [Salicola phage SCTP-2]|nr:terminase large subunit [Salicola phage SCTP-2]
MTTKFQQSVMNNNWEVLTDSGYKDVLSIHKTVEYDTWYLKTNNHYLYCADDHIVFNDNMSEMFVKNLNIGDKIMTRAGVEDVVDIKSLKKLTPMYDLQVNTYSQSYYTNGILSHNTAVAALYLLWYAMFIPDTKILVTSYIASGADEILERIQYAYEECPQFIKAGITTWSTKKIVFDNKSSIMSRATTENTGRGLSISLLYCLDGETTVKLRDKESGEVKEETLSGLYNELEGYYIDEMRKTHFVRIFFDKGYYLDVPEHQSLLVNDIKTTIENIHMDDKILINQSYYTVKDIDYI